MLSPITFRVLEDTLTKPITYTGKELRPHWGLEKTGVYGSLITAFVGPCDVPTAHLVDLEDRLAADHIRARSMLHFIAEFYGTTLEAGVLFQRLFMVWAEQLLNDRGGGVRRSGDDLFVGDRKLSVSIATVSPVSVLIHWALNIDPAGAPVAAIGLGEIGLAGFQVLDFAKQLLHHYIEEVETIRQAQCKVRPVID